MPDEKNHKTIEPEISLENDDLTLDINTEGLVVATDILPATNSNFAQADSGLISGLLLSMAQDYERAVFNPMADIDEIYQDTGYNRRHARKTKALLDYLAEAQL